MTARQIINRLAVPALLLSSAWAAPVYAKSTSKIPLRTITWCNSAAARIASARASTGAAFAKARTAASAKIAAVGAGSLMAAQPVASYFGVAAVEHVSGGWILSSVGAGGTGYMASTLGTVGANALGFASTASAGVAGIAGAAAGVATAPTVMGVGAGALAVGGGAYVYCRFRK